MDVASKQQKTLRNVLYYGLPVLAILMIAVGWVLFSDSRPELMPAPADVWARFVKTFTKPIAKTSLAGHAWASLRRVLMALLIAWAFGISFGILIGWNKKCKAFFGSIFEVIRPIPPIAWIPLVVVWMGIGLKAKALIIFFTAFVPCVINSYTGIKLTNKTLINVSRTFGASNAEIFWKVGVPSSLPMVFAGIRVALGNSWSTLVAAEMLAASAGLGYMIQIGRTVARPDIVIVGMVVIGAIGAILSGFLSRAEKYFLRWKVNR